MEAHIANLKKVQEKGLPYIAAIDQAGGVVGYAYLSAFRGGNDGYRHAVEPSLFSHPMHLYQGVGSALLTRILDLVERPEEHRDWIEGLRPDDKKVRHVIACMSVNTDSKDEGLGLMRYYEGFGFVLNGHLKQIGHKFDKW